MKKLDTKTLLSEFKRLRAKAKKASEEEIGEEINAARKK